MGHQHNITVAIALNNVYGRIYLLEIVGDISQVVPNLIWKFRSAIAPQVKSIKSHVGCLNPLRKFCLKEVIAISVNIENSGVTICGNHSHYKGGNSGPVEILFKNYMPFNKVFSKIIFGVICIVSVSYTHLT